MMVKKKVFDAIESNDLATRRWKSKFAAGRMAYDIGEFRKAETLLARAREMARELPERSFAESACDIGAAAIYIATDRSHLAKDKLSRIIAELKTYADSKHKEMLGVALRFHAQALDDLGDPREAEIELKKSAEILESLGSDAWVQLSYTLSDLAALYLTQSRYSEGERNITRAMQIIGNFVGTDSAEYTRADMIYAACTPMKSDTRMEVAEDGIAKMQYYYGAKHPNIARALSRYFTVLTERGDEQRLEDAKQRFGVGSKKGK